mgnify:CR=1 FL=1
MVVAPVGDGPGEIGYWEAPEAGRVWADRFTVDGHENIYILDKVNHRVARFDSMGHFSDIPYPQEWHIMEMALGGEGMLYLYAQDDGVKLLDPRGKLLQEYPVPSWLSGTILAMQVDGEGIVWVEGEGSYPNMPIVEGEPYPVVTIPLGNAIALFDEERQRAEAKPGHLLFSGGTVITHALTGRGPAFLYDQQGHRIYGVSMTEGVIGIDFRANIYTEEYRWRTGAIEFTKRLHKYNPAGQTIASFDLSTSTAEYVQTLVTAEGAVYCLVWNRDMKDAYRVVHWQSK